MKMYCINQRILAAWVVPPVQATSSTHEQWPLLSCRSDLRTIYSLNFVVIKEFLTIRFKIESQIKIGFLDRIIISTLIITDLPYDRWFWARRPGSTGRELISGSAAWMPGSTQQCEPSHRWPWRTTDPRPRITHVFLFELSDFSAERWWVNIYCTVSLINCLNLKLGGRGYPYLPAWGITILVGGHDFFLIQ